MNQVLIRKIKKYASSAVSLFQVMGWILGILMFLSSTANAAVRQAVSARTSDSHCIQNVDLTYTCDALPQSLTVNFSPTLAASKLALLATWTTISDGGPPRGSMGGCTDNLGQVWLYASGQSVLILPPSNATIAGLTSITCGTDFGNPGDPVTAKFGILILHFFEVTGAGPGDVVTGSSPACSVVPSPNAVTILSDYTGIVQNYSSDPVLGEYGVLGPSSSGLLTLDYLAGPYSASMILTSIYAAVGNTTTTAPMAFPNATRCVTVSIPQTPPYVETGINLGRDGECPCFAGKPINFAGEPINLTNGNVFISQQDYALPGLGGGIRLDRTWNSLWRSTSHGNIPQARMFGDSWTSNFEERIVDVGGNTLDLWRGDGSKYRFQLILRSGPLYLYGLVQPSIEILPAGLSFNSSTGQYSFNPGDRSNRVFDIAGYPISAIDTNGNTSTFTYDAQHHLMQFTDAASRSITFTYGDPSNPNQVTSAQDAVGTIANYSYDASGRLVQVTYADNSYNRFNYDANSLILSVTDTDGRILEAHSYDAYGRGLTSERANGVERIAVSYATNGVATLSDSVSNSSQYPFSTFSGKNIVTGVSGSGCVSCGGRGDQTFVYDSFGHRTSSTDALGNTTQFTYDQANVKTRSITVNGSQVIWRFTYNLNGTKVLTATDPLGKVTTNTYDTGDNLLTSTTPSPGGNTAGSVTTFTYNTRGQLLTVRDPLSHVTTVTYTPAGLVETVTDAQGKITRFEYDPRGNRTAVVDALNQRTTFTYDLRNRLTAITYPTAPVTSSSYIYDNRGRRTSETDENGRTTTYTYDDADRITAVTDAQTPAGVTHYEYDSEDNLINLTDTLGRLTHFEYDAQGRVTRTTFPSNQIETYTYDAIGNLISKLDRKNQLISYTYDPLQRLTRKQYPDASQVNYTFDADSRLTQVIDPTGTYVYTYDNMGRLTQTSTAYAFVSGQSLTVGYAWDAASNLTSMNDPQGGSTAYTYDTLNRLATLKNPQHNQFAFTYDALGRRTQLARPNAVNTNYQYDSLSQVTSLLHQFTPNHGSPTTLDGAQYSYDAVGNRQSKTDKRTNVVSNYAYDPLYELAQVTQGANAVELYSFDAVGNRLSSLGVAPYNYNASNELTSQPGTTYIYDANGSPASKTDASGMTAYSWDYENRLTRVTLPGGSQVNFKYDPMGRRIQKSSTAGTANYVYDGANILEEVNASGALVTRYTQNLEVDEPLAILKSGTTSYFEADGLGSVTSLSNSSGALVNTYTYDSFGKLTSSTGTITNPYRFAGRESDSETGLYYNRARHYDPSTGRFLSEDPTGFDAGVNFYSYVGNRPTRFSDPFGLQSYAQQYAAYGAAGGAGTVAIGSLVVDASTGGINVLATPAEITGGAAVGGWIGYGVGALVDYILLAKGGKQNILPSWVKARPTPGQSGKDFAKGQCDEKYGKDKYDKGPGSDYNKIKKWVDRR